MSVTSFPKDADVHPASRGSSTRLSGEEAVVKIGRVTWSAAERAGWERMTPTGKAAAAAAAAEPARARIRRLADETHRAVPGRSDGQTVEASGVSRRTPSAGCRSGPSSSSSSSSNRGLSRRWPASRPSGRMPASRPAGSGLSSSVKMEVVRDTGVDVDSPPQTFEQIPALLLANYWHGMPDGVKSTRTVRNHFQDGRKFFRFCNDQEEYGWKTPPGIPEEYSASKVGTPAMPRDPDKTKKVLAQGGGRLKMVCRFGLTCGYYQKDCTRIRDAEHHLENLHRFIKRLRRKASKPRERPTPDCGPALGSPPSLPCSLTANAGRTPKAFCSIRSAGHP